MNKASRRKIKKLIGGMCVCALIIPTTSVNAELFDRGGGLVYDDVLDITWLQDSNYAYTNGDDPTGEMTWEEARAWAAGLSYYDSVRNVTYDDWRLPDTRPINGSSFIDVFSNNASTDKGYAISAGWTDSSGTPTSELGHMYYVNWGNLGRCTPNGGGSTGCFVQEGYGLTDSSPFIVYNYVYWIDEEFTSDKARLFRMFYGDQYYNRKAHFYLAWAVRDGDVARFRCDLNNNNEIDSGDALQVLRMTMGTIPDNLDCDLNNNGIGDGAISVADYGIMIKIVLDITPPLWN